MRKIVLFFIAITFVFVGGCSDQEKSSATPVEVKKITDGDGPLSKLKISNVKAVKNENGYILKGEIKNTSSKLIKGKISATVFNGDEVSDTVFISLMEEGIEPNEIGKFDKKVKGEFDEVDFSGFILYFEES